MWFKIIASVSTAPSDAVAASLSVRQQRAADLQVRSCVRHNSIIGNICRIHYLLSVSENDYNEIE